MPEPRKDLFVALEGIDGSGKTTATTSLVEALRRAGYHATALDKRRPEVSSDYVASQLSLLVEAIWTNSRHAPIHLLGEQHWMHLHAAYLAALGTQICEGRMAGDGIVVVDGWIGKIAARMATGRTRSVDELLAFFGSLPQPDVVILLDVAPEVAEARMGGDFTIGETRALGAETSPGFVTYQSEVREILLHMAMSCGWRVYRDRGGAPSEVADDLLALLRDG